MLSLSNTNMDYQFSLSLILTISISCVIFRYIVRPFSGFDHPYEGETTRILTGEQTLELLDNIGLEFLTYTGSFCSLILLYLCNLGYLINGLNLNLSTLDPDVLIYILGRLKFLIANLELIFGVMSNFVRMYENFDINFDFDPELLEEQIRNAGNALFSLYRAIERELNIDFSDLPIH